MPTSPMNSVLQHLRSAVLPEGPEWTDAQLLDAFVDRREPAALEGLLRRHGPMVWGVCRRILGNHHDAEDAFQAAFLVLVRRAATVQPRQMVGNWLHGVARQTALKARAARARRRTTEAEQTTMPEPAVRGQDLGNDLQPLLDEELSRLPAHYRLVIVLCDLEGLTRQEAARRLGCPGGTVASRLVRARALLARRLARRGLTVTGAGLASELARQAAAAAVPASLLSPTLEGVTTGGVSAAAAALAEGVLDAMSFTKLPALTCLLLAALLVGGGVLTCRGVSPTSPAAAAPPRGAPARPPVIRELIEQLGDDNFRKREAAEKRLVAIGEPALELLLGAIKESTDAEVRRRARRVLRAIPRRPLEEIRHFEGQPANNGILSIQRVVVTPDGLRAVTGGGNGLRTWDLGTGKLLRVFSEKDYAYAALAVSADGKRLILGGGHVAHVFDLKTGKPVRLLHDGRPVDGVEGTCIDGLALSPDGKRAAGGTWRTKADWRGGARVWQLSLRVWDVQTGKELRQFAGVTDAVRCLAWSPDGRFLAAGHSADLRRACPGTLRLWDVGTGKEIKTFHGHQAPISSVAFSPDGQRLLTSGSYDHTVRLWEVRTGKQLKRFTGTAPALADRIPFTTFEHAAFTPDGKRVLACGNEHDPRVRLWDVATGEQLHESAPVAKGFFCLAALPDNHHCVTTGGDGVVRLWRWKKTGGITNGALPVDRP